MSDDTPTVEKPAESAQPAPAGKPSALPEDEITRLNDEIVIALKTVYDPEIPADIYEIGLIYRIEIADDHTVKVDMSLTSPNCPSAQELPVMVQNAVSTVPGVGKVDVSVVWDPPWDPSRMSEEARVVDRRRARRRQEPLTPWNLSTKRVLLVEVSTPSCSQVSAMRLWVGATTPRALSRSLGRSTKLTSCRPLAAPKVQRPPTQQRLRTIVRSGWPPNMREFSS